MMKTRWSYLALAFFLVLHAAGCWGGNSVDSESGKKGNAGDAESQQRGVSPGFSCDKASTKIEKMICGSQELSALDNLMSSLYEEVLSKTDDKDQIKQSQIAWLNSERKNCSNNKCLNKAYKQRIHFLNTRLAALGKTGERSRGHSESGVVSEEKDAGHQKSNFERSIVGVYRPASKVYWDTGVLTIARDYLDWSGCNDVPFKVVEEVGGKFNIEILGNDYCTVHGMKIKHMSLYRNEFGGLNVDLFKSRKKMETDSWVASGEFGVVDHEAASYKLMWSETDSVCKDFLDVVNQDLMSSSYVNYSDNKDFRGWKILNSHVPIREDLEPWYRVFRPPVATLDIDIDNDDVVEYLYLITYRDPVPRQKLYVFKDRPELQPDLSSNPLKRYSEFSAFVKAQKSRNNVAGEGIWFRNPLPLSELPGYSKRREYFNGNTAAFFVYKNDNKNYLVADPLSYESKSGKADQDNPWLVLFSVSRESELSKTCILKRNN